MSENKKDVRSPDVVEENLRETKGKYSKQFDRMVIATALAVCTTLANDKIQEYEPPEAVSLTSHVMQVGVNAGALGLTFLAAGGFVRTKRLEKELNQSYANFYHEHSKSGPKTP